MLDTWRYQIGASIALLQLFTHSEGQRISKVFGCDRGFAKLVTRDSCCLSGAQGETEHTSLSPPLDTRKSRTECNVVTCGHLRHQALDMCVVCCVSTRKFQAPLQICDVNCMNRHQNKLLSVTCRILRAILRNLCIAIFTFQTWTVKKKQLSKKKYEIWYIVKIKFYWSSVCAFCLKRYIM